MTDKDVSSSSSSCQTPERDELERMPLAPARWKQGGSGRKKWLSKQLSMCETPRDIAWERRRRQILGQGRMNRGNGLTINEGGGGSADGAITDEDLNELKGCIELGFGFKEEDGQQLCNTLPALDLYFAVKRQLSPSPSPDSTPQSHGSVSSLGGRSSFESLHSESDTWKIFNQGDDPQHMKKKLRHWAQAVACSVMQSK
ncbi:hypothetical protein SAY86_031049 [Trapa natans]|uniref:Uncharacterized protein n=1 Tax=Trapa natans TaxID=22666 RepID=A0AAN7RJ66_TRANT|nr:hypothetical protein SAY86_031049 [Trapa natans]